MSFAKKDATFLHCLPRGPEVSDEVFLGKTSGKIIRTIRSIWPHFLMGGASLSIEEANQELEEGWIDMITWGRHILANPDFVTRAKIGQEWISMTNEMREVLL